MLPVLYGFSDKICYFSVSHLPWSLPHCLFSAVLWQAWKWVLPQSWDTVFSASENEVEGRGKERHAFFFTFACEGLLLFPHLARWEKKTEFKVKHLRAFKRVLLICTLLDLHVTIHAEQTGHILPGTYPALSGFFSQTWDFKVLLVVSRHIFS